MTAPRSILHVDMDAFYASVEEREDPSLKGRPVIVGGPRSGRGVVSAANYEARKFGVHSAMPSARAAQLCPHGVFLPGRMSLYVSISRQIRGVFDRYTPLVEPLSLDEAFLDVTGSRALFGEPESIGARIRNDIRAELDLVASVGVAPNKFLAKLASDLSKPDGLLVVPRDDVQGFLDPLPLSRLWGVGAASLARLEREGLYSVGDLAAWPRERAVERFGRFGEHVHRLSRGEDVRRVSPEREAKRISHETTFTNDIGDRRVLRAWVRDLGEQVGQRLRAADLKARNVDLKLRYGDFETISRSASLPTPGDETHTILETAYGLLDRALEYRDEPVRLIGVGAGTLGTTQDAQQDLFGAEVDERQQAIDATLDAIGQRFGTRAVKRGGGAPAVRGARADTAFETNSAPRDGDGRS